MRSTDHVTHVAVCSNCGQVGPISHDATEQYGSGTCVTCWDHPEFCESCGTVHAYSGPCPPCPLCLRSHDAEDECPACDDEPYPVLWVYESGRLFAHSVDGVECATVEEQDGIVALFDILAGTQVAR